MGTKEKLIARFLTLPNDFTWEERLTPDIHTRVAYLAKKTGVSINSFIRTAVEKQIAGML